MKNIICYIINRIRYAFLLFGTGVSRQKCNRCGNLVMRSYIKGYTFQCLRCDEDLYKFEAHRGNRVTSDELSRFFKMYKQFKHDNI